MVQVGWCAGGGWGEGEERIVSLSLTSLLRREVQFFGFLMEGVSVFLCSAFLS